MNYSEIIEQGIINDNTREFLEKYFLREFKKAEKEQFFEADEFFNGCLKIIEGWENHLQAKVHKRKSELYLMLNKAKTDKLSYAELNGKTIEQKRQETIQYCEQELKDVRPDGIGSLTFTVHLTSLTSGRITYNMAYNEVLEIKKSIMNVFQENQKFYKIKKIISNNFIGKEYNFYAMKREFDKLLKANPNLITEIIDYSDIIQAEIQSLNKEHILQSIALKNKEKAESINLRMTIKKSLLKFLNEYPLNKDAELAQPHQEEKPKYITKHYVLAYLFDCDANNESYPIGDKKEVERIGNERMGYGKGNTFYKNFNRIINNPNFNIKNEAYLIDLIGENWLNIVTELSKNTELVKKHIKESDIIK